LQELDDIISANCDGPITLIGHSWGAWLGFIYAAECSKKVKKLIFVGSGPLEIEYAAEIDKNRMERLTPSELTKYHLLLTSLGSGETTGADKDNLMQRLGRLVEKADNYCAVKIQTDEVDYLPVSGDMYDAIWNEAAGLRAGGELLSFVDKINCPVTVILGEHDPHSLDSVRLPLEKKIQDFQVYILEKCGHDPGKEKYAQERFYEIIREKMK